MELSNFFKLFSKNKKAYNAKKEKAYYIGMRTIYELPPPASYNKDTLNNIAGGNVGNFVFCRAIEKYIVDENNNTIPSPTEENSAVIINCANLLGNHEKEQMKNLTEYIKKEKASFYFIGIGAQSDYDYSFNLFNSTKRVIKEFVKAVLNSGGGFGLRGYYTLEVLKKLGFKESDFTVTGCPSLYMRGRDFKITKKNLKEDELKTSISDNLSKSLFNKEAAHLFSDNTTYICQDELYPYLYLKKELPEGLDDRVLKMFKEKRVKLFFDLEEWQKEISKNDFSFGCRFHGNALALLNDVPAVINVFDSRTRELAEFFEIPHLKIDDYKNINLYELYENADYSAFNKNFGEKYDNFKNFFEKHNIPNYVGIENKFMENAIKNKLKRD